MGDARTTISFKGRTLSVGHRPKRWGRTSVEIIALIALPFIMLLVESQSYLYDYAFGAVYIAFVLLSSRLLKGRPFFAYVAFLSTLIAVGYFLSPHPAYTHEANVAGRFVKILLILVVALLLDVNRKKQEYILKVNSELAQNEQELLRRGTQLEQTNAELEAFAYAVSHDLRAPLRSIDGFSLALAEDYADKLDDTGKDYLTRVRTSAQRMGDLIDAILRLSRQTRKELQRQPVDISALSRAIVEQLRAEEPQRAVHVTIEDGLVADGDKELIANVMENLVRNAWKFTKNQPSAHITVSRTAENGQTVFCVTDNGAGFDMKDAGKLFVPFQRLHSAAEFPGIGIGLSTVKRIVQKHGGRIWAKGTPGGGASFCFSLCH